jgi:hypothetical protein
MMGTAMKYTDSAIERARDGAMEWLREEPDAYPRSWLQEERETTRRGYDIYDDWEAPPIAGYEALEREGIVTRLETAVRADGQERVHFRPVNPPPNPS